uniref:Uncharacterized protein n=1 Tax=Micrurus surinamensis TaxID=129470 RepID=A0A2D4PM16_MICSU
MAISCKQHWQNGNKNGAITYFMAWANFQDHRMAYLSNRKLISEGLIVWRCLSVNGGTMLQRLCSPEPFDYSSHNPLPLSGAYGKYCLFLITSFNLQEKKTKGFDKCKQFWMIFDCFSLFMEWPSRFCRVV